MADFSLYQVDLDTPQPNGRKGESPRAAFEKYNDFLAEIGKQVRTVSATPPNPTLPYMTWIDISVSPAMERRRNAANTAWVTIGPALTPFGDLAYQDLAGILGGGLLSKAGWAAIPLVISGVPRKLIINWGTASGSSGLGSGYPMAFPNAVLRVVVSPADKTVSPGGIGHLYVGAAAQENKATLLITQVGGDSAGSTSANYIAIGW